MANDRDIHARAGDAVDRHLETSPAAMSSIDRHGFAMSANASDGPRHVRLASPASRYAEEARAALIAMLSEARTRSMMRRDPRG